MFHMRQIKRLGGNVCGHEWQMTITHRSDGRGCSECARNKRKSKKNN